MSEEQPAANLAEGGDVAPIEEPQVVNLDAPQAPEAEAETPAGGDLDPTDDLDTLIEAEQAAETEDVEVEYEGETFKLPPKLKDALLREADYRKKTMEVAEQRRSLEQRSELVRFGEEIREEHATLVSLDRRISQLKAADISGWTQEQVDQATQRLALLEQESMVVGGSVAQKQQQMAEREKAETAKLRETAIAEAGKSIRNFSDQRRVELEAVAVELGVSKEDAESITDASAYKILHLADIGKKYLARQSKAAQMKAAQAGNSTERVGGMADGGKAADEMSMAEYIAARNAGKI